MTYKIELIENTKVVKVVYNGDVSLDERLSAVHELCRNYHFFDRFKLLIDSRNASQQMSKSEQIIFGRYLTKREEFNGALVATLAKSDPSINNVIVQEASKQGYQINVFNEEREAMSWLSRADGIFNESLDAAS